MKKDTHEQVGIVLGRVPSGCFVMTAKAGGRGTGMLTSWAQQAGFEPPMITACVRKGRVIEKAVDASGHFVLNLIGHDRTLMFRHFARGFDVDEPSFEGLKTRDEMAGVVLDECIGHLACKVLQKVDAGDHWVYVAEIIGGQSHSGEAPYVHVRPNGFTY